MYKDTLFFKYMHILILSFPFKMHWICTSFNNLFYAEMSRNFDRIFYNDFLLITDFYF